MVTVTSLREAINIVYFGDRQPTAAQRVAAHFAVFMLVLAVFGYAADFAPAPNWTIFGGVLAAVLALTVVYVLIAYLQSCGIPVFRRSPPLLSLWARLVGLTAIVFVVSWLAFVHGAGAALARVGGELSVREVPVRREFAAYSRSCHHRILATDPAASGSLRFCLTPAQYDKLEKQRSVVLTGWSSQQGFLVEGWHLP